MRRLNMPVPNQTAMVRSWTGYGWRPLCVCFFFDFLFIRFLLYLFLLMLYSSSLLLLLIYFPIEIFAPYTTPLLKHDIKLWHNVKNSRSSRSTIFFRKSDLRRKITAVKYNRFLYFSPTFLYDAFGWLGSLLDIGCWAGSLQRRLRRSLHNAVACTAAGPGQAWCLGTVTPVQRRQNFFLQETSECSLFCCHP